ncbi:hypothetical protein M0805_004100 [Coniferiporia weirii]|nr:hypothetical protein M0805_004100 [Coniferiporia weirii]
MSVKNEASSRQVLPPVRRVVTGHTPEGKAIVADDSIVEPYAFGKSAWLFTDVFQTDSSPPSNDVDFKDLAKEPPKDLIHSNGSIFRIAEVPPGEAVSLHRTVTLDYGILMQGTLTLLLDDNKRVVMKPGDVVVQRGTMHGFINEGDEWARIYFVIIPSQKVKIGDKELERDFPE